MISGALAFFCKWGRDAANDSEEILTAMHRHLLSSEDTRVDSPHRHDPDEALGFDFAYQKTNFIHMGNQCHPGSAAGDVCNQAAHGICTDVGSKRC